MGFLFFLNKTGQVLPMPVTHNKKARSNGATMENTTESGSGPLLAKEEIQKWQSNILPLMKRMIIGLTIFFFAASFGQLVYLHFKIDEPSPVAIERIIPVASEDSTIKADPTATSLKGALWLEVYTVERRHHQARVQLMSSIWVRYLGFVTGMTIALVGSIFILGKLQEQQSEIHSKLQNIELNIKSASPGIILVIAGTLLMLTTIYMQQHLEVRDGAVYFQPLRRPTIDQPPLEIPDKDSLK